MRLFVTNMCQSPSVSVFLCIWVVDHSKQGHMLTTAYNFERGGAKKLIIGSSRNNGKRTALTYIMFQCDCFSLSV